MFEAMFSIAWTIIVTLAKLYFALMVLLFKGIWYGLSFLFFAISDGIAKLKERRKKSKQIAAEKTIEDKLLSKDQM